MKIKWDTYTDIGSRSINEDFCIGLKRGDTYCFAVADGLGAHQKGEEASSFVCKYLEEHFDPNLHTSPKEIEGLIRRINEDLIHFQKQRGLKDGLRTTLVLLIFTKDTCLFANVGDSRMYSFLGNQILFQTKDHSVCQKLVDMNEIKPEEIRNHPDRGKLLAALGEMQDLHRIQTGSFELLPSTFLLCTDGLWENVLENEMITALQKSPTPKDFLDQLKQKVNETEKKNLDNHSAITIFLE